MRDFDVTVVGAGFAGLACARTAAARGLRTVVLERKRDPGLSPHTTGLLVKEVADEWEFPRRLTRKIHGVRLYSPSLRSIDLDRPGYYFLATDTPGLLRWLAAEAEGAGAEVRTGVEWGGSPAGRVLVGADGARSRVAATFGLGLNRHFLSGTEVEMEGVGGVDPDRLHCFLDVRLARGYIGWAVPGVMRTQIGLACTSPGRPRLDLFLRRMGTVFDLRSARVTGRRGGLIPVGGPVRPFATRDVVLVGDAAGLVSPLTAGGIHTALASGRRAAQAISDHLLDGGPEPSRALEGVYPAFTWKRLLRAACELWPSNGLLDLLFECAPFRSLARGVFFHHRGLFSAEAWRDLARASGNRKPCNGRNIPSVQSVIRV